MCGGTLTGSLNEGVGKGLSPRVRGNRRAGGGRRSGAGSIPACAGEPPAIGLLLESIRVYPRVCGGTAIHRCRRRAMSGLSPRVRGNPTRPNHDPDRERSIPACAGEPPAAGPRLRGRGVYPRVCGGTVTRFGASVGASGLSPRVRGNREWASAEPDLEGSIPACAGEPVPGNPVCGRPEVYPRVCGGTAADTDPPRKSLGLSPRVRGNRDPVVHVLEVGGSIPACAGEPR